MNIKPKQRKFLKVLLSLALLVGLIFLANPTKLWQSLSQVSLLNFTILMLLSFVMIGISAYKWRLFIRAFGSKVAFIRLFNLYLTGYFINIVFPSFIGGDALRSYYVGKSVGQHAALSATFLERYTGLFAMLLLGVLAAICENKLLDFTSKAIVIGIGLSVLVATIASFYLRIDAGKYRNKFVNKLAGNVAKLHELMLQTSNQPGLWFKALGVSFIYHFLTVVNTYVAALSVGWENPPIVQMFVVLPIILILGAIPITPSGLGIQEGAFFHFLQMLGATAPQALGVAILLRAKTYVLALLGWFTWSVQRKEDKQKDNDSKPDQLSQS